MTFSNAVGLGTGGEGEEELGCEGAVGNISVSSDLKLLLKGICNLEKCHVSSL